MQFWWVVWIFVIYIFICLYIFFQISAIMLISSSSHISNVKPCELKTALDYIKLEFTPHPCKHNSMKEFDTEMLIVGIINFLIHWILFYSLLLIFLFHRNKLKLKLISFLILIVRRYFAASIIFRDAVWIMHVFLMFSFF